MDLGTVTQWYDLTGRTIVITGGAGILGGEMACALVGCKADVAILDRDPSLAERLISRVESQPGRAIIVYGDALEPET
ncbi:MAG: D-mannonate oxidoreductase, partial [Thermoanaerobaculia bacterium]